MRELRTTKEEKVHPAVLPRGDILEPLISEVTHLAKSLSMARARAEEEVRLRLKSDPLWTSNSLKEFMRVELKGKKLFLISNREPYMHIKDGWVTKCIVPAGGLVTALDPVMRISDGIWNSLMSIAKCAFLRRSLPIHSSAYGLPKSKRMATIMGFPMKVFGLYAILPIPVQFFVSKTGSATRR
jgi:hypothetical protein